MLVTGCWIKTPIIKLVDPFRALHRLSIVDAVCRMLVGAKQKFRDIGDAGLTLIFHLVSGIQYPASSTPEVYSL